MRSIVVLLEFRQLFIPEFCCKVNQFVSSLFNTTVYISYAITLYTKWYNCKRFRLCEIDDGISYKGNRLAGLVFVSRKIVCVFWAAKNINKRWNLLQFSLSKDNSMFLFSFLKEVIFCVCFTLVWSQSNEVICCTRLDCHKLSAKIAFSYSILIENQLIVNFN